MRLPAALLLVLGACSSGPSLPAHPDQIRYRELEYPVPDAQAMRSVLSTGSIAYLAEDPSLPIVDLQIHFRGGSFDEPRGKAGLAEATATLMRTGGTKTRTPEALDEELDFLAANVSVGMGDVTGTASLSVLAKDLDKGLEILADVLRNPVFNPDKLALHKAQTLEELEARNDRTGAIEVRETNLLFYGDYPLNRLETKASVESLTPEDLIGFHRKIVHPSHFIIAAAGAFKSADLKARLETAFQNWPWPAVAPGAIPPVTHQASPGIYCFNKDGKNINQGRVTMGHLGVDLRNPDVQTIRVMSYILGAGGFSSRLMQKVRTEEGLAYDVRSDLRPGITYPLVFKIQFQSKSESCAYAAKLCLEELAKLQKDGVSEKELRDAQQFYLDAFPGLFFATKLQTASTFAQAELLGIPKDYYLTYREKIARVTPAEIKRVAREYLRPEKFAWVVVGNIPAIKKGDGKHPVTLADLGTPIDVPLADPLTLERPR
jgi:predicted Zn-dependent peptidase